MVRLVGGLEVFDMPLISIFQFHDGPIGSQKGTEVKMHSVTYFNSTMVRLVVVEFARP